MISPLAVYAAEDGDEPDSRYVTVTYDVAPMSDEDGETVIPGAVSPTEVTVEVTEEPSSIEAPEVTVAEGYEFSSWQLDGEDVSLPETTADLSDGVIESGSVTYTAVFRVAEKDENTQDENADKEPGEDTGNPIGEEALREAESSTNPEDAGSPEIPEIPGTVSDAVKAYLDAVKAITVPEEITEENQWDLVEQIGTASAAYRELSEEEQARSDVQDAKETFDAAQDALTAFQDSQISPLNASATVTIDGIKYTMITSEDGTCAIRKIELVDSTSTGPSELNIPEAVEIGGVTYTVTDIDMFSTTSRPRLTNVKKITFPATITRMSMANFRQFDGIEEIVIPGTVKSFKGTFQQNCKSLRTLTFEEGVEEVTGCNSFVSNLANLTTINLPESLTKFDGTFSHAKGLETIDIPEHLEFTDLGSLFSDCSSLNSVTLPGTITRIAGSMFSGCTALESVTAKGTITSIGYYAFQNCTSLKEIPDLSQVTELEANSKGGSYAFSECNSLAIEVDLSLLTAIPGNAFRNAPVTVTAFGNGLTTIGDRALEGTTIQADLPDSVTTIGKQAFQNATMPETVTIPDSVTSCDATAFDGVKGAKVVYIGTKQTSLESISADAFSGSALEEIIIASSEDEFPRPVLTNNENVKITYLYEAIRTEDDKISNDPDAMTLQEAVNAVAGGTMEGPIVLRKDVRLSTTLQVPAGNAVEIQSEDGHIYTLIGSKDGTVDNLIAVQEGATLRVSGLKLSGRFNKGDMIDTSGSVTLGKDVTISGSTVETAESGVVDVHGSSASLVIDGASITGNKIQGGLAYNMNGSATVRVSNSASIKIVDGEISGNQYLDTEFADGTAGILLAGNASGEMSGGTISGNTARRGAAIMLNGGTGSTGRTNFALRGGTISNNTNTAGTTEMSTAAGAVYISDDAAFIMEGGQITGNHGIMGGGVTVVDWKVQNPDRGASYEDTAFVMNGGTISGNDAYDGGGIYSYSNGTQLDGGKITGNTASNLGGGVYVEGNKKTYSTIQISNVYVTENNAAIGGGLWLCPTGDASAYIKSGGVINQNTARTAGNDVVSARKFNDNYSVTLANRILGGGTVEWHEDGVVKGSTELSPYPKSDGTNRYDNGSAPLIVENYTDYLSLKSVISADDLANARKQASLFIFGNTAENGGGIASNGGVTIGEANPIKIKVIKKWDTAEGTTTPTSIDVQLLRDGAPYGDAVTLQKDNEWSHVWEQMEDGYEWSVKEVSVPDRYVVGVENETNDNGDIEITITNTYVPETIDVSVNKVWDVKDGTTTPASVTVQLMKDGKAEGGKITLSKDNDWRYTWKELETGHDWTVQEVRVPDGYTASTQSEVKDGVVKVTITNKEVPEKPKTPDTPGTPDKPHKKHGGETPKTPTPGTPVTPVTPVEESGVIETTGEPGEMQAVETSDAVISTGDDARMEIYAILMGASVVGLAGWYIMRRRQDVENR